MRTLGFRTHVLLVVAGAMGVLVSLSRVWYDRAPAPAPGTAASIGEVTGPLEGLYHGLQRWATATGGMSGWTALGDSGTALAAFSVVAALGAAACAAPALQGVGRELLRYAALAVFAIAAWRLVDPPGSNATVELRHGALAGAACALMLFTSSMGLANAPLRRRAVAPRYVAPPPPAAYEPAGAPGHQPGP
jgi:hypothetical protein